VFQLPGTGILAKSLLTATVLVLSGALFAASSESSDQDIIARNAPPGTVCLIGDSCAGSASVAAAAGSAGGSQDPQQIYNTYCVACHGTGANNSPILGDTAAWQPRIDKGLDELYLNAINGFNNNTMPAKGLCMGCSDDEVRATVDFILSSVQ